MCISWLKNLCWNKLLYCCCIPYDKIIFKQEFVKDYCPWAFRIDENIFNKNVKFIFLFVVLILLSKLIKKSRNYAEIQFVPVSAQAASWASLLSRLCFFYCDMVHLGNTSIYRSQQGLISDSPITPFERVNCNLETSTLYTHWLNHWLNHWITESLKVDLQNSYLS